MQPDLLLRKTLHLAGDPTSNSTDRYQPPLMFNDTLSKHSTCNAYVYSMQLPTNLVERTMLVQ